MIIPYHKPYILRGLEANEEQIVLDVVNDTVPVWIRFENGLKLLDVTCICNQCNVKLTI